MLVDGCFKLDVWATDVQTFERENDARQNVQKCQKMTKTFDVIKAVVKSVSVK